MIFRTSDIGIKSAVEVLRRLSGHSGSQLTAYGIRHIAGCVVHDSLCIVCDGAVFRGIGDIRRCLLCLRGLAFFIRDFRHGRILGIDLMILILPILVLNLEAILCRSDFRIGLIAVLVSRIAFDAIRGLARIGAIFLRIFGFGRDTICCHIRTSFCPVRGVPVFGIIDRPFFIMGELALGGMAMICYFSQIRNPIRRDGGSTIMLFTGCCFQLIIFQVDLAYIELAIDRQVFLCGDIFFKCCFAFRGQFVIERGLASDTELAADGSIPRGLDSFSRQILHATHIPAVVHSHFAFDGGLGVFRVPFDTAGAVIDFPDFGI